MRTNPQFHVLNLLGFLSVHSTDMHLVSQPHSSGVMLQLQSELTNQVVHIQFECKQRLICVLSDALLSTTC